MPAPIFPLAMPTSPGFTTFSMRLRRNIGVNESPYSGHQQTQVWPLAKWQVVVTLPPMNEIDAGLWSTFFLQVQGRRGTFLLGDPTQKNTITSNGSLVAATAAGAYDINARFAAGVTGSVRPGQKVQLGSGAAARLYQITTSASITSGRTLTFGIEPTLKAPLAGGSTVTLVDPVGAFRMLTNDLRWDANSAYHHGFSFACEAVE